MAGSYGKAPSSPDSFKLYIHLVSDATGTAVERMARAALVQFHKNVSPVFIQHPFIKTCKQLNRILDEAEGQQGMVLYTMNERGLRKCLDQQKAKRTISIIDMLGPILDHVATRFLAKPALDSSLLRDALGDQSLRLAKCIDFTLRHDDGHNLDTIGQANIILIGVSRTSKTPTSIYLSCNYNLKVANVPLILNVEPPKKLLTLKRPRMIGLTIAPQKLLIIRRARYKDMEGYSDVKTIRKELAYSKKIFDRIPKIKIIDVTDRPIEEVANLIL